jgi:hypothetical protein
MGTVGHHRHEFDMGGISLINLSFFGFETLTNFKWNFKAFRSRILALNLNLNLNLLVIYDTSSIREPPKVS